MSIRDEYASLDAVALAEKVRVGEVKPSELLELATGEVKVAILMAAHDCDPQRARSLLEDSGGFASLAALNADLAREIAEHPTLREDRLVWVPADGVPVTSPKVRGVVARSARAASGSRS